MRRVRRSCIDAAERALGGKSTTVEELLRTLDREEREEEVGWAEPTTNVDVNLVEALERLAEEGERAT